MNKFSCACGVFLGVSSVLSSGLNAEMVTFTNTNPGLDSLIFFDANSENPILGQALNVTRNAFDQPEIGDLPGGSVFFLQLNGPAGDFIWMGMGMLSMIAQSSNETLIPDPFAGHLVPYFGPQEFTLGDEINASANFVDGFRSIHGVNKLTDELGIFSVDETFTVAILFEQIDGVHYGYARFERTIEVRGDALDIRFRPLDWGYETIAGVGVHVIPSPGMIGFGFVGLLGLTTRNRRR